MAPSEHGRLFPEPDETDTGSVFVNERCRIQTGDDHRVVSVAGVVLAHYAVGDRMAEAYAMVTLVDQGRARQTDVARAFGVSERTVRRHQRRFEVGGLAALGRPSGYPRGRPRVPTDRGRRVHRWKSEGLSSREIARRLGVTEKAVRKHLRQLGWKTKGPKQLTLDLTAPSADPNLSAPAPPPAEPAPPRAAGGADPNLSAAAATEPALPPSIDADPADRRADRLLAALGLLDDAAPLFGHARGVPGAGVLLALPALAGTGVLECVREVYGSLAPAFYGLRTTLVTHFPRVPSLISLPQPWAGSAGGVAVGQDGLARLAAPAGD